MSKKTFDGQVKSFYKSTLGALKNLRSKKKKPSSARSLSPSPQSIFRIINKTTSNGSFPLYSIPASSLSTPTLELPSPSALNPPKTMVSRSNSRRPPTLQRLTPTLEKALVRFINYHSLKVNHNQTPLTHLEQIPLNPAILLDLTTSLTHHVFPSSTGYSSSTSPSDTLDILFAFLSENGISLPSSLSNDILQRNDTRATAGLCFCLILHFYYCPLIPPENNTIEIDFTSFQPIAHFLNISPTIENRLDPTFYVILTRIGRVLAHWCLDSLFPALSDTRPFNFHTFWSSGYALYTLLLHIISQYSIPLATTLPLPNEANIDSMTTQESQEWIQKLLLFSKEHFGVPTLLDAEDMVQKESFQYEEMAMMLYIAHLFKFFIEKPAEEVRNIPTVVTTALLDTQPPLEELVPLSDTKYEVESKRDNSEDQTEFSSKSLDVIDIHIPSKSDNESACDLVCPLPSEVERWFDEARRVEEMVVSLKREWMDLMDLLQPKSSMWGNYELMERYDFLSQQIVSFKALQWIPFAEETYHLLQKQPNIALNSKEESLGAFPFEQEDYFVVSMTFGMIETKWNALWTLLQKEEKRHMMLKDSNELQELIVQTKPMVDEIVHRIEGKEDSMRAVTLALDQWNAVVDSSEKKKDPLYSLEQARELAYAVGKMASQFEALSVYERQLNMASCLILAMEQTLHEDLPSEQCLRQTKDQLNDQVFQLSNLLQSAKENPFLVTSPLEKSELVDENKEALIQLIQDRVIELHHKIEALEVLVKSMQEEIHGRKLVSGVEKEADDIEGWIQLKMKVLEIIQPSLLVPIDQIFEWFNALEVTQVALKGYHKAIQHLERQVKAFSLKATSCQQKELMKKRLFEILTSWDTLMDALEKKKQSCDSVIQQFQNTDSKQLFSTPQNLEAFLEMNRQLNLKAFSEDDPSGLVGDSSSTAWSRKSMIPIRTSFSNGEKKYYFRRKRTRRRPWSMQALSTSKNVTSSKIPRLSNRVTSNGNSTNFRRRFSLESYSVNPLIVQKPGGEAEISWLSTSSPFQTKDELDMEIERLIKEFNFSIKSQNEEEYKTRNGLSNLTGQTHSKISTLPLSWTRFLPKGELNPHQFSPRGKFYRFGDATDPLQRKYFCTLLANGIVMVRVGGGYEQLQEFLNNRARLLKLG